ncbi:hypothetical protein E4V99_15330 [Microbacterium sp. dk485]|uniref:hypothetical protein n=1 Tax=Microbacterium sp. dk485 TaxID=2560021 RepID=UPI0010736E5C|nr:hypothetical protein [Microbacterium sp. dk485]TFV82280.1 hypothetical protein E4V99_15330 [Microbacterium sp. dk485]
MTRRAPALVGLLLAAAVALSGCGSPPSPGEDLRTIVVAAAESAAAGDLSGATTSIDELESRVRAAREAGALTADDAASVLASIALVRADLAALATPAPEPEQPATVVPDEQTPVETPAGDTDPAQDEDDPTDNGNKNEDKGKGKDKGKEKEKGEDGKGKGNSGKDPQKGP